jgi:hypothetical protein
MMRRWGSGLAGNLANPYGSEQSDAAQVRDNQRAMLAFKKRVDRVGCC